MNISKTLNIASAVLGLVGTFLMYRGTFGLVASGAYMNTALLAEVKKGNDRRQLLQRIRIDAANA
ncbi:hypothetical protein Bsp3421_004792 [Burkholderia sp. FERM BP-3421]|uniref:hypothetical protein n=1 Tax=Burkholderia sp. FERM BP-3421 TaxID=1494466 RepID=UPI0023612F29|nr:hypothetical protein [Burkholderia sp. FERM BP-3421]WDD94658.1 hypothetical protein Bsp3421_004792 [Burkholderia sp. FERM BP-3421]